MVEKTGQGTRDWSEKETQELLEKGKVKGYQEHHIKSVKGSNPKMVGNPDNIKFVRPKEHLELHKGNWRNPTDGELLNRKVNP